MNKKFYFKKNGNGEWVECGGVRNLVEFNRDFADWVCRYFEGCEQSECATWDDAKDVLDTVGASAMSGTFKIVDF